MKKCKQCNELKPLTEYRKEKNNKDGRRNKCNPCRNEMEYKNRRTKDGLISIIYNSQKYNSKVRNHQPPTYTKKELKNWVFSNPNFTAIYEEWISSGYEKDLKPSIDRLNNYKGYSFDNIQLTTWKENSNNQHKDVLEGRFNKTNKAVIQMDLEGNFIKVYHSISHAGRCTGVIDKNISCVCNGKRNTAGGYKWKFRKDQPQCA